MASLVMLPLPSLETQMMTSRMDQCFCPTGLLTENICAKDDWLSTCNLKFYPHELGYVRMTSYMASSKCRSCFGVGWLHTADADMGCFVELSRKILDN